MKTKGSTMRVIDHGGGVWSLPVPIPDNPLGHTLVYLLDTDRGPVLIDTGWDDPASYDALERGLVEAGTRIADIHGVLITHHHPDHHGLSGQVREASGAWIAMHEADAHIVRRNRGVPAAAWFGRLVGWLSEAGAPDGHLAPLRAALAEGRELRVPGLDATLPDRQIVPGELVDLAGRRLRAIWTPGHTPGHVCLNLEEDLGGRQLPGRTGGRLFSGDHLLPGITPHIGLYARSEDDVAPHHDGERHDDHHPPRPDADPGDPLGDYLDSLERVARLAPAQVLPAHQHAFDDAEGRVRALLDHHAARLTDLRGLIADTPRTPWELAEVMEWNRPWERIPYISRNIAVSEVIAHLRRLVKAGHAEAVPGTDPVAYQAV